jgi:hypothetical protein
MKRSTILAVISAIIVLVGIILIPASDLTIGRTLKKKPNPQDVERIVDFNTTWKLSELSISPEEFTLNKGDVVFLEMEEPTIWGEYPYDLYGEFPHYNGYQGIKEVYIYFNYTQEKPEKTTQFELIFYQSVRNPAIVIYDIYLYMNRSESLVIEDSPTETRIIGGIANYTGNYSVTITGPFPPPLIPSDEPTEWAMLINVFRSPGWATKIDRPYKLLFPVGIGACGIGLASMIISLTISFRKRKTMRHAKLRAKK